MIVALATVVNLTAVKNRPASIPSVTPPQTESRMWTRVIGVLRAASTATTTIANSRKR